MQVADHYSLAGKLLGMNFNAVKETVDHFREEVTAGRSGTFRGEQPFPENISINERIVCCVWKITQVSDRVIANCIRQDLPKSDFSDETQNKILNYLLAETGPSTMHQCIIGSTTVVTHE